MERVHLKIQVQREDFRGAFIFKLYRPNFLVHDCDCFANEVFKLFSEPAFIFKMADFKYGVTFNKHGNTNSSLKCISHLFHLNFYKSAAQLLIAINPKLVGHDVNK